MDQITVVEKETLIGVSFPAEAIDLDVEELALRDKNIHKATQLGNNSKTKCRIIFHDGEGFKQVETTIWAEGKENIALKYGITVPINRIAAVKIL